VKEIGLAIAATEQVGAKLVVISKMAVAMGTTINYKI
jgi:hypothetical protein